jgi:hypothetical protein
MSAPAHDEFSALPRTPAEELELLTLDLLKGAARNFTQELTTTPIPSLYGVTDGKAVGTFVEGAFNTYIAERYKHAQGNAAKGIDFPSLGVDLKVTSVRQPQSSCPFRDATQKVYGLGYHLLVMVYEKVDDQEHSTSLLKILHVIFIDQEFTADFQTTKGIADILDRDGNADDIDAFLEERNLPLNEIGRRSLAERIMKEPPCQGHLTISNALQWRLQYGRAISSSASPDAVGLEDLVAQ